MSDKPINLDGNIDFLFLIIFFLNCKYNKNNEIKNINKHFSLFFLFKLDAYIFNYYFIIDIIINILINFDSHFFIFIYIILYIKEYHFINYFQGNKSG